MKWYIIYILIGILLYILLLIIFKTGKDNVTVITKLDIIRFLKKNKNSLKW